MATPTVTVTLTLNLNVAILQDINTCWLSARVGLVGVLAAPVAQTDTTIDFQTGEVAAAGLVAGQGLVIDDEPFVVSSIAGDVITVLRVATTLPWLSQLPQPPTLTHAAGAAVYLLQWPEPWNQIADEALRPWAQQKVLSLGPRSTTFGTSITGNVALSS